MIITPLIKHINDTPNKDDLKNLLCASFDMTNKYHKMVLSYIDKTTIDVIVRTCMTELVYDEKVRARETASGKRHNVFTNIRLA